MRWLALWLFATHLASANDTAQFTRNNQLVHPGNYREWIFLSSGLGMTYGPNAPAANSAKRFDNVYVNPSSYRKFARTGKWQDGTVFILEIRESESKGSINQHGFYQTSIVALEAHVRDSRRFPNGGSAFFDLKVEKQAAPSGALASGNRCEQCHIANGAVENTFVQFYPELVQ
ncbi:MAG: cytochrome P460 family protein [Bryobacteraceae bacterium]